MKKYDPQKTFKKIYHQNCQARKTSGCARKRKKFAGNKGITVIELLVSTSLLALLITLGVPGFISFAEKIEVDKSLGIVSSALSSARYEALEKNYRVKLMLENNRLVLKRKINRGWEPFKDFFPGKDVTLTMNAYPVFSPEGYVAPLCSIMVISKESCYKISLSIAGRIKVLRL